MTEEKNEKIAIIKWDDAGDHDGKKEEITLSSIEVCIDVMNTIWSNWYDIEYFIIKSK